MPAVCGIIFQLDLLKVNIPQMIANKIEDDHNMLISMGNLVIWTIFNSFANSKI
jgi:hypothetical protein